MLSIYNWSDKPIFVGRLNDDEFVDFEVIGPDGRDVPWQGKARIGSTEYSPSDFAVLEGYHEISAKRVISLKDGAGFVFDKPGQYSLTAEYSLGPPESVARFAGETKIPAGIFRSTKAAFCIEVCVLGPLPGPIHLRSNTTQAALDAVRVFYAAITRYRPLGIPHPSKVLWPLLSKRLARELDSLESCDADYYRRYGDVLKANQYKPATPWLEEGLFSGPNEAADPVKFSILGSRAIGESRVDVHLKFTLEQSCCDYQVAHERYEGVATVILEHNRWVIDDYVAMYENDELLRLSEGFPEECKGGQWVGEPPY
ncbi:MAG TPA: hypothetical protein VEJ46_06235 [Candidatus Acidoferrum sp.]|nr:hypothetical protein [Candidatus Acidoferrum sp.]